MSDFSKWGVFAIMLASSQGYSAGLSLDSLLADALRNNPDLLIAKQESIVAAQDSLAAKALFNPSLSLEAMHNLTDANKPKAGIRISQEFRPGVRSGQLRSAKANWSAILASEKIKEADLIRDVRMEWFSWQILHRKLVFQQEVEARWQKLAQLATAKVAEGRLSQVEETQAQLNQVRAGQKILEIQAGMETIRKRLAYLSGSPLGLVLDSAFSDSLPVLPPRDSLAAWSMDRNPDIQTLDLEIAAQKQRFELEQSLRRPSFSVSAGYDRESDGSNLVGGGVELPLPLFNRNQAGVAKAKATLRQSELRKSAAQKRISVELDESYGRLVDLSARYRAYADRLRPLSRKQLALSEKGFLQGVLGMFDLSRVQEEALTQEMEALDLADAFYLQWNRLSRVLGGKI